jgi:hypothetical protein
MGEQRRIIKVGGEKYDVTDWSQGDIDQLFEDYKKHRGELIEQGHSGRLHKQQQEEADRDHEQKTRGRKR